MIRWIGVASRLLQSRCLGSHFALANVRVALATAASIAVLFLSAAPLAFGQTWDGGGSNNNWSTPANWVGDTAPATFGTANVVMSGGSRLNPNVDRPWDIFSLTFAPSFGTFNITGQTLRISSGGISVQGGVGHTISAPLELGGTQNWIVPLQPASFRVFELQTTPFQLSVRGGVEFAGTIRGAGRIRFLDGATQRLLRPNSYSGGTEIAGGLIEVVDDALGIGRVTLDGGTIAPLSLGGPPVTLANDFTLAESGGTIHVRSSVGISGAIDGPGGLSVGGGSSVLTLTGQSSYAGETRIQAGTLRAANAAFTPGAAVNIQAAGTLEAAGEILRPISGTGVLTALGPLVAGDIHQTASIDFAGTFNVGPTSVQLADADAALLRGNVRIDGGTLASTNGVLLAGTLAGFGVVTGSFANDGIVNGTSPNSPLEFRGLATGSGSFHGHTRFTGTFAPDGPHPVTLQNPQFAGTLQLDLGGAQPGTDYEQLLISGAAQLGGILDVTLVDGFQPTPGQQFVLISGSLQGEFAAIQLPPLAGSNRFLVRQTPVSLTLYVVPEPASFPLFLCGLATCLFCITRSRRAAWRGHGSYPKFGASHRSASATFIPFRRA